jgi:hypothetical protein
MKFKNVAGWTMAALAAVSLSLSLTWSATAVSGAKDMFAGQLNSTGEVTNLGLAYSIELRRDGKVYKVDNRFPFRSGDQIRFHVRPNVDGYMYIVLEEENGSNPKLMFPRPGDEHNAVTKGHSLTIPEHGVLTFDENPGTESLKLVLSTKKLEQKPTEMVSSGMTRSITIRPRKMQDVPNTFLLDFAALDPDKPSPVIAEGNGAIRDFDANPATTMVSQIPDKPLIVDLLLRHAPGPNGPAVVTGSSPVSDKWAVVVGISSFKDPRWNLHYPDKDAKDFAQFLVQKCHFAPDHVKVLTNSAATRERILTDIGSYWLPKNAKENDLVCVFMATHGTAASLDAANRNFLMAHDTNPLNPYATGIELQDLARNLRTRLRSKRVVVILDTCHAGAVEAPGAKALETAKFDMRDLVQGTGHVVIASAAANQTAHDSARYQNGIFTKHLMDGLAKHSTLHEAFNYAKLCVQEESTRDYKQPQTPILRDADWKGEQLKLAVPPVEPRKPEY